ncbi:MAG: DinB family protein [Planctomycetota bacterium]|jgi:uncharacterized damage-inducible protein DinB
MPDRVPWTERTFSFDFPVDLYPELMERLRATPPRVQALVRALPPPVLTRREAHTWSIQENIGHLADLESLFMGRLDDCDAGAETLRAADMTNRKTNEANHNARQIDDVLSEFRTLRGQLVARLEAMRPEAFARSAMHPRLGKPMRVVDMMLFHAEHDDYHLARIQELIRRFTAAPVV